MDSHHFPEQNGYLMLFGYTLLSNTPISMCVCSGNHPLPNQPDELSVSFDLGWTNFICSDLATHSRKMSTMRHLKRGLPAVMPNEHSVTCQPYSEELYINLKKQGPLRQQLCQSNQWSTVSPASIIVAKMELS